jgi:hypothetical protein
MPLTSRDLEITIMSRKAIDVQDSPWIERRTRVRYRLVLPVIFRWSDGTEHSGVGYCRNIGLGGIFIVTSYCPPADIEIEIDVVVPVFNPAPGELLLRHTGRLVRIQACEDLFGFAVAGQFEDENAIQTRVTARAFGQQ